MANTTVKNVEVVREGTKIILPEGMSYDQAVVWMMNKKDEDERMVAPYAAIAGYFPLDSLVAFNKALADIYGWVGLVPTPGFFGDTPPFMVTVQTGPDSTIEIPFGQMSVPAIAGTLRTGFDFSTAPALTVGGKIRQKGMAEFHKVIEKTKEILAKDSIYRGKALKLSFDWKRAQERGEREFHPFNDGPKFLNLNAIDESNLIFDTNTDTSIKVGLFTPIEKAEMCRAYSIPLKRGILLEGPYGTGKSLTALVTAKKAVQNGWTFVYLNSVLDLEEGLKFAAAYAPAVVFCEDVDKMLWERSLDANYVLNLLDGIDTKRQEIITIFTTNHVERIEKAFMRPGRLDTVVHLDLPDASAASRLAKLYGGKLINPHTDWKQIGEVLAGNTPAMIREIVEKSKIAAVARMEGGIVPDHYIEAADIVAMATLMENHRALLAEPAKKAKPTLQITLQPDDFEPSDVDNQEQAAV